MSAYIGVQLQKSFYLFIFLQQLKCCVQVQSWSFIPLAKLCVCLVSNSEVELNPWHKSQNTQKHLSQKRNTSNQPLPHFLPLLFRPVMQTAERVGLWRRRPHIRHVVFTLLVKGSQWRGIRQRPGKGSPTAVCSGLIQGFTASVSLSATKMLLWETQEFSASSPGKTVAYCMHRIPGAHSWNTSWVSVIFRLINA